MVYLCGFIAGFSLLHLGLGDVADVTDPCPFWPGALQVDGQCYKAFQEHLNNQDAQDFCDQQSRGAHLPEILTIQQRDVMKSIMQSFYITDYTQVWLGVKRNARTGFEWVQSGRILDKNSSFWCENEPNNVGSNEECATLHMCGFVDIHCGTKVDYIAVVCQKDPRPVTNPCYFWEGATYINGKCFKSFNRSSTWPEALEFCKNQTPSSTLAELFTDQDINVLSEMRQKMGSDGVWLGCSDIETENTFLWTSSSSSTPVPCGAWWSPGQPSNNHQQKHCVVLNAATSVVGLENVDCHGNKSVVCQTKVHNPCAMLMSPQAEYFQGRCFLFRKDKENWDEAQRYCNRLAGYLTEPTTTGLQDYVLDLASRNTDDAVWVGGVAKDGELRWRYTGDLVRMQVNPVVDDCWLQVKGQTRAWSCTGGNSERYFICERDIGDACETYLPGAVYSYGQCFRYFEEPKSWEEAQAFCDEKEASLAEPSTSELSDVVNTYLQSINAPTAWIGGTVLNDTNLQWKMSGHSLNFSLLKDSQSNQYTEGHLAVQYGSFWSIEEKHAVHPFVCQRAVQLGSATQRSVVAMFPKLQNVDDLDGYVQITGTALSYQVALKISTSMDARDPDTTSVALLEPRDVLYYKFDPGQLMHTEGLHSSYIHITSSSPVTAVLYIFSSSQLAASTLLLPSDLFQTYDAEFSCFLVSVCKSNCAGNIVAAATLDGPSDVNMLFHKSSRVNSSLYAGGVTYRQITTVTATTMSKRGSVYFNNNIDFDGSYLSSKNKLAVLIGGSGASSTDDKQDFALDQVLPIQFIARDYTTFPSVDTNVKDFVKVVAVESDTKIQIYDSELGDNNRKLQLDKAGDVEEIQLLNGGFLHLSGSAPYYAFKFSRNTKGSPVCLTSLYPNGLWKHQYHFRVPSELADYKITVAVIVSRQYTSDITFGDSSIAKSCTDIRGTQMAGCIYDLLWNNRTFYHLRLRNFRERLGAYMIATSATSVVCHSLGTRDSPLPSYTFNSEEYRRSFSDPPECDHSTTATVVDTTSESSETNSPSDRSPEADRVTTTGPTLSSSSSTSAAKPTGFNSNSGSLCVGAKETSAYRRSKISVPDNRVSSVTIGSVGIICLVVTFGIVVIGDIIRFCKFLDDSLQKGKSEYFSFAN